jgi:hypothetical protein
MMRYGVCAVGLFLVGIFIFSLASCSHAARTSSSSESATRKASVTIEGDIVARGNGFLLKTENDQNYDIQPYIPAGSNQPERLKIENDWNEIEYNMRLGDHVKFNCPEIDPYDAAHKRYPARCEKPLATNVSRSTAAQYADAASEYIEAHFSHCGDSYYLLDYAGVTPMGVREYRGLQWPFQLVATSDVDRLNGITARFQIILSATAYRQHGPYGGEWSEWRPGFSTFFNDPSNATGVGTGTQAVDMVQVGGKWRTTGSQIDMSKPQACSSFPT